MQAWTLETWLAVGSSAAAVVSFLLNWAVVRRQTAMQAMALRQSFEAEAIAWGFGAIAALGEAAGLARSRNLTVSPGDVRAARDALTTRLSVLIDQGRIYFPNRPDPRHGAHKPDGFAGHRPVMREALVLAHGRPRSPERRSRRGYGRLHRPLPAHRGGGAVQGYRPPPAPQTAEAADLCGRLAGPAHAGATGRTDAGVPLSAWLIAR